MPAWIFWGNRQRAQHPYETDAVNRIHKQLEASREQYFIFANFYLVDTQIDLAILKSDCICIVELKNCQGRPVLGKDNGPWKVEGLGSLPGESPVHQIIHQYHQFRGRLEANKEKFLSKQKAMEADFTDIKKIIALYPKRHPKSKIAIKNIGLIPPNGDILGLDEVPGYVQRNHSKGFSLEEVEIRVMAETLGVSSQTSAEGDGGHQGPNRTGVKRRKKFYITILIIILALISLSVAYLYFPSQYSNEQAYRSTPTTIQRKNSPKKISWKDTASHYGEYCAVKGKIVDPRVYKKTRYLNFSTNWSENFSAVIYEENLSKFPANPEGYYRGKKVMVTGYIEKNKNYKKPQIILKSPDQIEIIN